MASLSDLVASQIIPEVMQKLAGLAGISGARIMFNSPVRTFRASPKRALFLALVIGFPIGPVKIAGVSLGNATEQALALAATLGLEVSQ